jgi:putative DNA primase/helicase
MVADTLDIRDLRQWLCWRSEKRDGKPTKIPYSPITGLRAIITAPETWASYEEAVRACKEVGYSGIGFVFTPEDDLCGVDLDGCLDPVTREIEPWAWTIIEELDSYTEVSPSGTGVHIVVRATLPEGRNRKGRFEAYDRGRYFTVTGKHLAGTPQAIEGRQEELRAVVRRMFGEESANGHTKPIAPTETVDNGLSDSEVVRKALSASNGPRFSRLWNGDTSGYGSNSEADLALCAMLAFWTGPDPERIDALFRQSGLYREKWERVDYRERTIDYALDGKTEFYGPWQAAPFKDNTANDDSGTDKDLVGLPEAASFPVDALPKGCRWFVREAAASIGCAPDLVAVPLLGQLSAGIGNSRQVELKRGWREGAALFAVVVAEPGDKKTPAQKTALAPVWRAQERFKREYRERYEAYEEELRQWKADERVAAKDGEPAPPKPEEPVMRHAVVDDITVERLADILDETPRGVISVQDELSGWVLAMNQYKAGGKGADRQFWLRVWSNAPVKVDRKSRKVPAIIAQPWVSVIGSIQPEILPGLDIGRNDGMMDRFLYSYPELRRSRHTDDEISPAAEQAVLELYGKLAELRMPESEGEPFPGTVPITEEAWQVFKELAEGLSEEAHALGFPKRLRGAWSKLEAYLARLSLILALSRVVDSGERERVEPRDVLAGSVLVDYFKAHARRVFAELHGADPTDSLAVTLREFLEESGGRWEGTATELREALSERRAEGLPANPDNLSVKVLSIASRSKEAMRAERGWKGKHRVLRLQLLEIGVGSVGGVGGKSLVRDTTNTANTDSEHPPVKAATITREPDGTPHSLTMPSNTKEPVKGANLIKDARAPRVDEVGTLNHDELEATKNADGGSLKGCIHGLPGGKNCYLCDPDHPYRQREGTR